MKTILKSNLVLKDFLNIIENATGLKICLYDFEFFSRNLSAIQGHIAWPLKHLKMPTVSALNQNEV